MKRANLRLLDLSNSDSEEVNRELFVRLFNHLRRRTPHVMVRPFVIDSLEDRTKRILKGKKLIAGRGGTYWRFILYGLGMRDDIEQDCRNCGKKLLEYFGYLDEMVEAEGKLRVPVAFATFTLADFTCEMFEHEEHSSGGSLVPTDHGERHLKVTGKLLLPKIPELGISPRSLFTLEVLQAFLPETTPQAPPVVKLFTEIRSAYRNRNSRICTLVRGPHVPWFMVPATHSGHRCANPHGWFIGQMFCGGTHGASLLLADLH